MNVAQVVRLNKEKQPELYCREARCLWRVSPEKPCPRHPAKAGRKRCQNCGDYEDVVGDGTCTMFEKDAGNPFGRIPIYGVHEWFEEKA